MTRRQAKIETAAFTRYRVVIEDEPSVAAGNRQLAFLRQLAGEGVEAGFLACGMVPFQTLTIQHDGVRWVAVMEATEEKTQ